jgi:glutamate--cysteine ligase
VEKFASRHSDIDNFIQEKSSGLIPPLYLSCDIRNSGRKIGVIDTNLFPGGFNNLCNAYSRVVSQNLKYYINKYYPSVKKIIILSEEHTRNRYYLENVERLGTLLQAAGMETRVAHAGQQISQERLEVPLDQDKKILLEKLKTENGTPQLPGFEADLVISNNDFSLGIPELLQPIMHKIIPHPGLGWHRRQKTDHFKILGNLIRELCDKIDLDPWLISCIFREISMPDLTNKEEQNKLADVTKEVLADIQSHYDRYDIKDAPYVFIKNNSGTYGMGLLDVSQPEEILQMNRRTRNKLLSTKGGNKVRSFLIQEGIPTADFYSELPIEPVIYMVGFKPIGGFFRMNAQQDAHSSLNTRGMAFSCLCLHKLEDPHEENFLNCAEKESLVKLSTVMARIAALAAAMEMKHIQNP